MMTTLSFCAAELKEQATMAGERTDEWRSAEPGVIAARPLGAVVPGACQSRSKPLPDRRCRCLSPALEIYSLSSSGKRY